MKFQLITMKSCRPDPIDRKLEDTKNSRKKYCNEILKTISCCTQRNRGRSYKSTKWVWKGPLLKAPNDIIIHNKVENNAFNGEKFAEFINELIEKCKQLNHDKICFIMDNVRMHKTEESIKDQCAKNNIDILFLPVYSPELNPIEKVFSILRTTYHDQFLEAPWGQKARRREKIINDALKDSLPAITSKIMNDLWEDMLDVTTKVFENEDI